MKKILVNASAAKTGGAETIIRTFVSEIPHDDNKYIVLSPIKFEDFSFRNNISFIYKSTSGFNTVFFTLIGIFYYVIRFRPKTIISFNNINYILSGARGITYFHQSKVLRDNYSDTKIIVYKTIIKLFLRRNNFIVQSELIKDLFLNKFPFLKSKTVASWAGFTIPKYSVDTPAIIDSLRCEYSKIGVIPIAYNARHKNISSLNSLSDFFKSENVCVISLLDPSDDTLINDEVYRNIGAVTREDLYALYNCCDFIIFPSKDETLGLPIFEFLQFGKPAFVYNADYAKAYSFQFNHPENFLLYNGPHDFEEKFIKYIETRVDKYNYSKGEWHKIFDLI